MIDDAIDQMAPLVGTNAALHAVGVDRATWYRRHRKSPQAVRPERIATPQPRALSPVERKQIKAALESDEFVDEAPATIYAKPLDQGIYLGSVATMYRILHQHDEVRERRRQATHPAHKKPELIATAPNSVWSWDITKLHGPEKWLLLPLRDPGHLQPLRGGVDAGPRRAGCTLPAADRRHHRQARRGQRPADPALGSGVTDDRQTGGPPAGRPRSHQIPQSAPRE